MQRNYDNWRRDLHGSVLCARKMLNRLLEAKLYNEKVIKCMCIIFQKLFLFIHSIQFNSCAKVCSRFFQTFTRFAVISETLLGNKSSIRFLLLLLIFKPLEARRVCISSLRAVHNPMQPARENLIRLLHLG